MGSWINKNFQTQSRTILPVHNLPLNLIPALPSQIASAKQGKDDNMLRFTIMSDKHWMGYKHQWLGNGMGRANYITSGASLYLTFDTFDLFRRNSTGHQSCWPPQRADSRHISIILPTYCYMEGKGSNPFRCTAPLFFGMYCTWVFSRMNYLSAIIYLPLIKCIYYFIELYTNLK